MIRRGYDISLLKDELEDPASFSSRIASFASSDTARANRIDRLYDLANARPTATVGNINLYHGKYGGIEVLEDEITQTDDASGSLDVTLTGNEHRNLDDRTNDEDLPIWLCVDPSRDERETRKNNGQIGAPMENNPAIPQLIASRRLLTTISHGIPSSQQRCRNAALNRKSPDSENLFSHARRDARRADGKQRLQRRAPPIIHDVDQLRARGATSRLFQRLARAWDVLDGAQAV